MSDILTLNFEQSPGAASNASEIGRTGENLAAQYLIRRGARIVCSNFKVPIGRNIRGAAVTGEIDLIALEQDILCFIEVKTRSSDEFAAPLSAVDVRKQRQITRTARIYRKIFNLQNFRIRFDVVGIILAKDNLPKIEYFKNFWTEAKFRKKYWNDEIW
jgi:putative endonuclease